MNTENAASLGAALETLGTPAQAIAAIEASLMPEPAPQLPAVQAPTLASFDELASRVNAEFEAADKADNVANNYRVAAGLILKEAKKRLSIKSSQISFAEWCEKHVHRSKADIYRCLALVSDEAPEAIAAAVTKERTASAASSRRARAARVSHAHETTPAAPKNPVAHVIDAAWVAVIPKDHAFAMLQGLAAELTHYVNDGHSMRLAKSAAIEQSIAACRKWLAAIQAGE